MRFAFPADLGAADSFPAWRAILAGLKPCGTVAQFKPAYLRSCARIARMITPMETIPILHFGHNGDGAALVTFGDNNIAMALMPCKMSGPRDTSWIGQIRAPASWSRA